MATFFFEVAHEFFQLVFKGGGGLLLPVNTAVSPCSSLLGTFRQEEHLHLSDRISICTVVKSVQNLVKSSDWST